jgi:2-keto-4-pentenoate hydratase/2-oxohepta-3-ene-1,7-dioic acid hydratase in catechol pathway
MVPKIASARITLSVNGELKQDSTMSDIIVGIYDLVSSASKTLTLEPGDVILAGTPAGVGMHRQTFLRVGDLVEATIEGVGSLRTFIGEAA